MAILEVISGSCPGQIVELLGERMVMGRHPTCHIVIDNAAVSRNHAQILENHGAYYVEDLRSRNGTQINGKTVKGRVELQENDEIRVCEMAFRFRTSGSPEQSSTVISRRQLEPEEVRTDQRAATVGEEVIKGFLDADTSPAKRKPHHIEPDSLDGSSIISTLDVASTRHPRIAVRPEAKLRAVLEISKTLGNALDLTQVLPRILDGLFHIFPQADRGAIVLKDPDSNELHIEALKNRRDDPGQSDRLSSQIIHKAMKSAQAILSTDVQKDVQAERFSKSDSVYGMRVCSLMCAPLVGHGGESQGVIQLDTRDTRQQFSQDDLDVLASVAAQAVLAVENARLHASVMHKRDLERELQFAHQVQLGFLPTERPHLPGYEFYDFYEAAYRVGGDFFDYVPLPDGRVAMALGDVAGKGVPAALLMARMYASARYELLSRPTAAGAMDGLNNGLVAGGVGHRFVTMILAILDPRTHVLTMVNAGHLPPLRRDASGKVTKIGDKESGLPLGVKPDYGYHESQVTLAPGDSVLMFTDGVTEAMNPANDMYGSRRLLDYFAQAPEAIDLVGEQLIADIESFCENCDQRDDICVIGFQRLLPEDRGKAPAAKPQ